MEKLTNKAIVKNLMEFGLSEKEAEVYLALLQLEIANATEIAKQADVNRSSTYVVLDSLKEKGLVSTSEKHNVQHYVASHPDMLLFEAQNKAQKAENIKKNISEIIPELKALHKGIKQKPTVRIFEGKQALIAALNDSLNNKGKVIRECFSAKNYFSNTPEVIAAYTKKRVELGITLFGIHPDNDFDQTSTPELPKPSKLDRSIGIPEKQYQFPADMLIYDNRIAYFAPDKKGFAIIIESQQMADVMKTIFELAYKEALRIEKIDTLVSKYKKSIKTYK